MYGLIDGDGRRWRGVHPFVHGEGTVQRLENVQTNTSSTDDDKAIFAFVHIKASSSWDIKYLAGRAGLVSTSPAASRIVGRSSWTSRHLAMLNIHSSSLVHRVFQEIHTRNLVSAVCGSDTLASAVTFVTTNIVHHTTAQYPPIVASVSVSQNDKTGKLRPHSLTLMTRSDFSLPLVSGDFFSYSFSAQTVSPSSSLSSTPYSSKTIRTTATCSASNSHSVSY